MVAQIIVSLRCKATGHPKPADPEDLQTLLSLLFCEDYKKAPGGAEGSRLTQAEAWKFISQTEHLLPLGAGPLRVSFCDNPGPNFCRFPSRGASSLSSFASPADQASIRVPPYPSGSKVRDSAKYLRIVTELNLIGIARKQRKTATQDVVHFAGRILRGHHFRV